MLESRVRRRTRVRAAAPIALAWVGVLAAVLTALVQAGAPLGQVLAYVAAWVLGSTFPGVMVWRALAGHGSLVTELGFGSVLGILLQLATWAAAASVHHSRLMWALPLGVAVGFAAVPSLRRHWRPRRQKALLTPARWHVAMAVVIALAIYRFERLSGVARVLPPHPSIVNRDTWYNTAISYELSRTVRPQDPFAVGEALRYHWFADAHVTATAQLSGVPITTAMVTLWLIPMLVVLLLAVAAAAQHFLSGASGEPEPGLALEPGLTPQPGADPRRVAGRWWVGPVTAFFVLVAPALWRFGAPGTQRVTDGFIASSPSGILAIAVVLTLSGPILDLLRGRGGRGTWVLLTLLLAGSVGTKPSILPDVAFAAVVVLVLDLVRRRRLNRPMCYVAGESVLLAACAAPILTGSTGGSRLQLLALVTSDPSYAQLLGGARVVPAQGGWLVPALAERLPDAVPVVGMLLVVWFLTEVPRLLSLVGLSSRELRRDPGVRWAAAVVAGGYAAMWVLGHPGYSEHYFWTVTIALATVLTVTNAVRVIPAGRRGRTLVPPLTLMAVPGVVVGYVTTRGARVDLSAPTWTVIEGRLRPYALVLAGMAVAIVLALLLRWVVRRWSLPMLTAVTAFALAACLPVPVVQVMNAQPPRLGRAMSSADRYSYVSPEQEEAALWLQHHSATTSVVATNIFCWPMGRHTPHCWINSMWLGGLTGRRLVLGDWSYSAANMSRWGGVRVVNSTPAPWPERRTLSTEAVQSPTPQTLGRLRREYKARWIFADSRATRISPKLRQLATLRYESAHIQIYRLHNSYA